jgi:hypothetical protein
MLLLNHYAECLCKAFKTDCRTLFVMELEIREILLRADTTSEAIELIYDLSKDENIRSLYLVTMGRMIERMEKEESHEVARPKN